MNRGIILIWRYYRGKPIAHLLYNGIYIHRDNAKTTIFQQFRFWVFKRYVLTQTMNDDVKKTTNL